MEAGMSSWQLFWWSICISLGTSRTSHRILTLERLNLPPVCQSESKMRVKNDHEASPYAHWWFYFEVEDGEESENTIVVAFPLFLFEFIKNNALVFPKRAYTKRDFEWRIWKSWRFGCLLWGCTMVSYKLLVFKYEKCTFMYLFIVLVIILNLLPNSITQMTLKTRRNPLSDPYDSLQCVPSIPYDTKLDFH